MLIKSVIFPEKKVIQHRSKWESSQKGRSNKGGIYHCRRYYFRPINSLWKWISELFSEKLLLRFWWLWVEVNELQWNFKQPRGSAGPDNTGCPLVTDAQMTFSFTANTVPESQQACSCYLRFWEAWPKIQSHTWEASRGRRSNPSVNSMPLKVAGEVSTFDTLYTFVTHYITHYT